MPLKATKQKASQVAQKQHKQILVCLTQVLQHGLSLNVFPTAGQN